MLVRALYNSLIFDASKSRTYSDVRASDWFAADVGFADMMGLTGFITGTGSFKPDQEITREEMAYMVAKAVDYAGIYYPVPTNPPSLKYFDKAEIDGRFGKYVEICTNLGLLHGSGGNFMPKKSHTRAEAAAVLNRFMNLLAKNI
jgi:hypothetical protein